MQVFIVLALLVAAVFASYKLAIEKEQNKIIWPAVTLLIGPGIFIIQYLVSVFINKRKIA